MAISLEHEFIPMGEGCVHARAWRQMSRLYLEMRVMRLLHFIACREERVPNFMHVLVFYFRLGHVLIVATFSSNTKPTTILGRLVLCVYVCREIKAI